MAGSGTDYLPNPFASNTELLEGEEKEEYLETLGIKPKKKPIEEEELDNPSRKSYSTMRREGSSSSGGPIRRTIPQLRTLSGAAKKGAI